ncbi:MAG: hypothetical protein JOZ51_25890, partial [Chloroflexi bacterium]|nr:hypothetical protein [Chloroflexota bacterium]
ASSWMVLPEDPLVLLGRDQSFVLVQCSDGRVGYLPASVCEPGENSLLFSRIDPFNFGCFVVGGALFSGNWMVINGQLWVIEQFFGSLSIYLVSLIVFGIAASLWWLGSPRAAARSFALGMVLSYAIMVLFEP